MVRELLEHHHAETVKRQSLHAAWRAPSFTAISASGFAFEIAGVDGVEARLLNAEIFQAALHRDNFGGGFRPHVAVGVQAQLADAGSLDAADARNERQPLGEAGAVSFDVDHIAAAEHLPAEFGHRAHQRDAAAAEHSATRSHTLCTRSSRCEESSTDTPSALKPRMMAEQFRGRMRVEPRRRLVENGDLRAFHQNFRKPEALAHAAGESADAIVGDFGKSDALERVGDSFFALSLS